MVICNSKGWFILVKKAVVKVIKDLSANRFFMKINPTGCISRLQWGTGIDGQQLGSNVSSNY